MKKCSSCGTENADEQKFCSECGAKLDEGDKACPSCGAHNPPTAKFCGNCGARLVVQAGVCPACGKQNAVDAKFCADCGSGLSGGAPVKASAAAPAPAAPRAAQPEKSKASGAEKVAAFKSKTAAFESKHNVLVNAVIAVIALVIALVSLFAPVKVMAYYPEGIIPTTLETSGGFSDYDSDEVAVVMKGHYVEVSQPFWRVFAAAGYLDLNMKNKKDADKIKNIMLDYEKLIKSAATEVSAWAAANGETDVAIISKKTEDVFEKKLSAFNYLGYELASQRFERFYATMDDDENTVPGTAWTGVEGSARVTVIFALVIVALMLAAAILSIVFLSLAVAGMVNGSTKHTPYTVLKPTMILMTVALCAEVFSPMLKAGGSAFAVMLFAAIAYLVYAVAESLFTGRAPVLVTVKRAIISVVGIVVLFLLFTNAMTIKMVASADSIAGAEELGGVYVNLTAHVPFGYGFFELIGAAAPRLSSDVNAIGAGISGIVVTVLATVMTALAAGLLIMSLKFIIKSFDESDDYGASPSLSIGYTVTAIIGFMVMLGTIIFAATASSALFNAFAKLSEDTYGSYKLYINAQVYVSMILLVAAYIFDIVFKPSKKSMQNADATVDLPAAEQ